MTQESIQPILDWISNHPTWSGFVVFLISLSESLAIVGLVVPGVVLMTAIGGMMGAGILPFWLTLFWAILGAIAGDGISYWLGYHYHERLRAMWPFKSFPKLMARGEAFFQHHGGKSIVFGRFVGPVRPMIPVIAGMMDMTPKRFLFFNILSAIVWAPLYSLPGILIGASLGSLSPEVASRAGILVLILLLALWVIYEIILLIGSWLMSIIERAFKLLWKALNKLPGVHQLLLTPRGSEHVQLGILSLFVISLGLFIALTFNVVNSDGIAEWNEPIFQVLRALYSTKYISLFGIVTELGSPWVLLPFIVVFGMLLTKEKYYKAAACWTLTILGGYILGETIKHLTMIPKPEGLLFVPSNYAFPSGHTTLATLTFGFAAILAQDNLAAKIRWIPAFLAFCLISLIAFSRIYLGLHWFTDMIGGLLLGTIGLSAGIFLYRRIENKTPSLKTLITPSIIILAVCFSLFTFLYYPSFKEKSVRQWSKHELNQTLWWQGKDETNKLYRTGAFKRQATLFDVQWLAPLSDVEALLERNGWKVLPKLNLKTWVMLLAKKPDPITFPVMPKFHRDRLPVLTVAKPVDEHSRMVLQIWQSDYINKNNIPLWVGTLRLEDANHPLPLVTIYIEQAFAGDIFKQFKTGIKDNSSIMIKSLRSKMSNEHKILLITKRN